MRTAGFRLAKAVLRPFGYDFEIFARSTRDRDADTGHAGDFYIRWISPSPVWAPWRGEADFRNAYDGVEPYTVVSADRCQVLYRQARQSRAVEGDFAECGVYRGGTALLVSRAISGSTRTMRLFDSFEGLPAPDPKRDPDLEEGVFRATSVGDVERLLCDFDGELDVRAGWIPETFAGLDDRRYAFVHIDVDLYRSTLDCLDYFYPRLSPGAVVVFDDYGFPAARGEKDAVDEFFADRPEEPLALPTGQALVTKLPLSEAPP